MLIHRYYDVKVSRDGMRTDVVCNKRWGAYFKLEGDTREVFPYINCKVPRAQYTVDPLSIKFEIYGINCTLYPTEAIASPLAGRDHAFEFIEDLVVFINELYDSRSKIEPNYKIYQKPASVVDIVKALPRTNCTACGYKTCMAFAAAMSKGQTYPDKCPTFATPISVRTVYPVIGNNGAVESTISVEFDGLNQTQNTREHKNQPREKKPALTTANSENKPLLDNYGFRIQKNLTSRELQVLRFVAEGASNPEISELMGISPNTVKSHVIHIFNKISANDRTQAAVWAVRNNII